MSADIGITFSFEQLAVTLDGKPYDLFGECSVVGNRTTWRIVEIAVFLGNDSPFRLKPGTEMFETVRITLHRQCAETITARMNSFVEHGGGYAILYGVEMPTDRFQRCRDQYLPANRRVVWAEAA